MLKAGQWLLYPISYVIGRQKDWNVNGSRPGLELGMPFGGKLYERWAGNEKYQGVLVHVLSLVIIICVAWILIHALCQECLPKATYQEI